MRGRSLKNVYLACLVALGCGSLLVNVGAAEYDFRGQTSGWHIESQTEGNRYYHTGIRYIPQLSLMQTIGSDRFLDLEISLNGYASTGSPEAADDSDLELYRLKLRFATAQTETRLGLQKLNFGPALLLRSLRWFDRLDPRDPLKLTEGVYALRFKYDALNNANLWLWGLYGNDQTKGYELLSTVEGKTEFGGRLQYPILDGELAFTFHNRKVDASLIGVGDFTENRFALDGKWDIEIGFWFESILQHQRSDSLPFEWKKFMTLGMDYTLGIGNGLHILGEHMATVSSDNPFRWEEDVQASAYSLNYPMGYLDNISAIGFYSWENEKYYQYLAWQRTWDNWILNFSLFHYPDSDRQSGLYESNVPGRGYGGQVIIIFNH